MFFWINRLFSHVLDDLEHARSLTGCGKNGDRTGKPEPVKIDLARTAVVVVDMQNAFASKGGMFDLVGQDISGAKSVIATNKQIITAARKAGIKVIYLDELHP